MDNQNENTNLTQKEFEFLGEPTATNQKKDKGTKKHLRPIIALACVAVLLFGALGVLKLVAPEEKADITTDQSKDTIQLSKQYGTQADSLEIKNQLDEYKFVRRVEKTYYIEGKQDLPVRNSKVLSALTYAGTVTAATVVKKSVKDFEQYGLTEPVATVRWTKGDVTHYFELGNVASSGNYYMRFNGGDTVYTYSADAASMFITKRMDYYETKLFSYNNETDGPYITEFTFQKKGGEKIVAKLLDLTDEDLQIPYLMTSPITHNFSSEKFETISALFSSLTELTVYDDDVSEESLKKYGLLDPEYTFSFTNVATKNEIRFGKTSDEGYVYAYAEGKDFIYIIDKSTIQILSHNIAAYCDTMSYTRSYDTVESIDIVGGGKSYHIDISGSSEDDDLKAYINNKYVEYENFASLYAHIISIDITDVGTKPAGAAPLVTVTVNIKGGGKDVLKYYKQSALNSFYELNGAGRLYVPTSKVENILTFAQQLYDGKEIVLEW